MSLVNPDFYPQTPEDLPLGDKDAVLETLYEVGLPEEDYLVIGGASMVLRGVKAATPDIDILVSSRAMDLLVRRPGTTLKSPPLRAQYMGATNTSLWVRDETTPLPISATDELGDGYFPMSFNSARPGAETVSHVPCIPLNAVRRSKEALQRPKDIPDLAAIAQFMGRALELPTPKFAPPYETS